MSRANHDAVLDLIFGHEGGYTDHPKDPGGPTNYGITLKTLSAWRKAPVTADDVKALTLAEAEEILASEYLPAIRFDDLPSGLDYCVADCAVNSGPAQAARILQRLVGVKPDGQIGAQTLAAVDGLITSTQGIKVAELIKKYCAARLAFMKSLSTWSEFGKGWQARVEAVEATAYRLAVGVPPAVPVVLEGVQAKASASDTKVTSTPAGQANAVALIGAVGTGAAAAAAQLQPFAGIQTVQTIIIVLTIAGAAAGLIVTLMRAKSGSAT